MWMTVDKSVGIPLARQIYARIRASILNGDQSAGMSLPSSRGLAKELGVSRNTVLEAYNQLLAEGYVETRRGSGTVVARGITRLFPSGGETPEALPASLPQEHFRDVVWATADPKNVSVRVDFRSGLPALEAFPQREWAGLYRRVCARLPAAALRYCDPAGVPELREALARYLLRARGLHCAARNIMIVSGSTQGLSLIAGITSEGGRDALVEDPLHPGLLRVITASGCTCVGVPADDDGMDTTRLPSCDRPAFIYTTPSHQYPLGGILPIRRRLDLLRYASEHGCYIVEDDYDGEFRYGGPPLSALFELDPARVIYVGSFSKILAPALRIGFLILPDALVAVAAKKKMYMDVHTESLSQHVLATFIDDGGLEKHILRMRRLYAGRREHLLRELRSRLTDAFQVRGEAAGLHIVVRFDDVVFTPSLTRRILEYGVKIYPVARYAVHPTDRHDRESILGYAHLRPEEITEGVRVFELALRGRRA